MAPDIRDPEADAEVVSDPAVPQLQIAGPAAPESAEQVPELKLQFEGSCENHKKGKIIELNQGQREELHVEVGQNVELIGPAGEVIGVFTVARGAKANHALMRTGAFRANAPENFIGQTLTIRASKGPAEGELRLQRRAETAPGPEQRMPREYYIEHALGLDPKVYVTIPKALATQMGITSPIAKGKIAGADSKEHEMAIVVTESAFVGFTTQAAKLLNLPAMLNNIKLRVEDGKLVM